MKNTLETRLGLFVALIVIAAVLIIEILGGVEFKPGYRLRAMFDTVQDLKVGDRVKMAGVEIGVVDDITLVSNKVLVTMKMRPISRAPVKTDSIASVRYTGLLGQNYVLVDFGSAGAPLVANNAFIETKEQPDLNSIMAKLDQAAGGVQRLTESFTGDKIDNILGPITGLIRDTRASLSQTITNFAGISDQIRSGQGTIGMLIYSNSLYNTALTTVSNLQGTADEIKATVADARKVIDDVNAGRGSLGMLMTDKKLYNETAVAVTNFKEILQKINQGQGTIGKLVNDQEFYRNAKLSLQKLDKAADGLEDTGPLSILGSMANSLF